MAEDKKKKTAADDGSSAAAAASPQIRVRLDDSELNTEYANYANVSGSREEILVDFGMNTVRRSAQPNVSIKISHRFVLSPYMAKRLALMMSQAISAYESKFGSIEIQPKQEVPDISRSSEEVERPN